MSDQGPSHPVAETSGNAPLQDISNTANGTPVADTWDPQANGWAAPAKYDYDALATAPTATLQQGESLEPAEISAHFEGRPAQWAATAARYEYKEEYGDVAPPFKELERELFNPDFRNKTGDKVKSLEFTVKVESRENVNPVIKFDQAGLHPVMLENIKLCGYEKVMPIQAYSIPAILTGHDLIAVAQTGSGKTAAFLIPILSKLMGKAKKLTYRLKTADSSGPAAQPLVLIIVPTRELAIQIFDDARRLCYRSMLRPCVAYGGGPVRDQLAELSRGCDILIGTPGRLKDFMGRGDVLSLKRVKYTVIDEADEMVGIDWQSELQELLSGGDNNEDDDHRYLMFSATFNKNAQSLAQEYLKDDHIRIKVGRVGSTHTNIIQNIYFAAREKKREALRDLLRACQPVRTIIFVNSKHAADEIDDFLYNQGFPSTSIHSDRTQREREDALNAFRTGAAPILVTTGVTARGLDVFDVGHVINFDLPKVDHGGIDEYVHRIGRTGRIGNQGVATSFYNEDDEGLAKRIVKLLIENAQEVPDFLEQFKPEEGQELNFDEDEDDAFNTDSGGDGGASGGWGEPSGATTQGGDAWGADDSVPAANGWGSLGDDAPAASQWAATTTAASPAEDNW